VLYTGNIGQLKCGMSVWRWKCSSCFLLWFWMGYGCLMLLSTIFHITSHWSVLLVGKSEYTENSTDLQCFIAYIFRYISSLSGIKLTTSTM